MNFWKNEQGLALTEYLVLLGLLSGGIVFSVLIFGGELGISWENWSNVYEKLKMDPNTVQSGIR